MSDLPKSVEQSIIARGLLRRGERVLVAVSGGADSMVLLSVLHDLSQDHGWRLAVAHFNHQLRGRSSDADEAFVRRTTQRLGLKFIGGRADIKARARKEKLSIEMAARKARHEFLAHAAQRLKIRTIALAHHADDQLELFFLRLLRGSGSDGLSGMKWRSSSPAHPEIKLIRPLLNLHKAILLDYAEAKKIRFREDGTNASLDFQRNRIRHELLPLLREKYQPALEGSILRILEIVGAEGEFVTEAAEDWLKRADTRRFEQLHRALQRRCLQLQLFEMGVAGDFDLIEKLRKNPGTPITVAPGRSLSRNTRGRLGLSKSQNLTVHRSAQAEVQLNNRAGEFSFHNRKVAWEFRNVTSTRVPKAVAGREIFDADKVGAAIVLRHWRPGDRFQPIGMARSVKLQNLFINQKIPREERHRLVVATTLTGELFWVEKLRISERFKVSDTTIRRLLWHWNPR